MTIAKLIQKLQTYPQDLKVVTEGYEDGYDDVLKIELIRIKPAQDAMWYNGSYELSKDDDALKAIFINGENKGKRIN